MDLLFRGRKYTDEFLTDYIERISIKNGFSNVKAFKKSLRAYYYKKTGSTAHALRYEAVGRVALEIILHRHIPVDEYYRFYFLKRGAWRKESKMCLSCWSLSQHIRFYWWLQAYDQCHIHNEPLHLINPSSEPEKLNGEQDPVHRTIVMIIKKYAKYESSQSLILDDVDRSSCDMKIIGGLVNHFNFSPEVNAGIRVLKTMLSSGDFLGNHADERIQLMANTLSKRIGTNEFWMRILALIVLSNKRGMDCKFPLTSISREYTKFCSYYMYTDGIFANLQEQIKELKEYAQMGDVCIKVFLCNELKAPDSLILKLKASLFSFRYFDYHELNSSSRADSVYELLPSYARAHHVNREL
ncbi:MAG: hypothetical protein ACJAVN_001813 [Roseivirga sp.]|jgi:hypothetical protein